MQANLLFLEVYCMGTAIRYKPLDLDYNIPIRKDLFRIAPELMVDFFFTQCPA